LQLAVNVRPNRSKYNDPRYDDLLAIFPLSLWWKPFPFKLPTTALLAAAAAEDSEDLTKAEVELLFRLVLDFLLDDPVVVVGFVKAAAGLSEEDEEELVGGGRSVSHL
jgi:hypothetical protein